MHVPGLHTRTAQCLYIHKQEKPVYVHVPLEAQAFEEKPTRSLYCLCSGSQVLYSVQDIYV